MHRPIAVVVAQQKLQHKNHVQIYNKKCIPGFPRLVCGCGCVHECVLVCVTREKREQGCEKVRETGREKSCEAIL